MQKPLALFVDTFLCQVDPLQIPGIQDDLQWVNVHKRLQAESVRQHLQFCRGFIEVVLARTEGWPAERVATADGILERSGSFTLSELRSREHKKPIGIGQRGKIRTSEEHAMVRSAVDDGSLAVSRPLRAQLEQLLANYEDIVPRAGGGIEP